METLTVGVEYRAFQHLERLVLASPPNRDGQGAISQGCRGDVKS
jgi:hypothetical protein